MLRKTKCVHRICATHKSLIVKKKASIEHGYVASFAVKDTNLNEFESPTRNLTVVQKSDQHPPMSFLTHKMKTNPNPKL